MKKPKASVNDCRNDIKYNLKETKAKQRSLNTSDTVTEELMEDMGTYTYHSEEVEPENDSDNVDSVWEPFETKKGERNIRKLLTMMIHVTDLTISMCFYYPICEYWQNGFVAFLYVLLYNNFSFIFYFQNT